MMQVLFPFHESRRYASINQPTKHNVRHSSDRYRQIVVDATGLTYHDTTERSRLMGIARHPGKPQMQPTISRIVRISPALTASRRDGISNFPVTHLFKTSGTSN